MKSLQAASTNFMALRRRLDQMGYDFPLGIDSAQLVSQMLEDLVTDTEALRENADQIAKLKEENESLQFQVEPLKLDASSMKRENAQLHQQLIASAEEAMKIRNENMTKSFELHAENRKLRLLNKKTNEHMKDLQQQIDSLKEKLQQSLAAPASMRIPEVLDSQPRKLRQKPTSSQVSETTSAAVPFAGSGFSFDINLFNTELENLRMERDQAKKEAEGLRLRLDEQKTLTEIQKEEVNRLSADLQRETGSDGYLVSLRYKYEQQKEEIEKLRAQVRVANPCDSRHRVLELVPAGSLICMPSEAKGQVSAAANAVKRPLAVPIHSDTPSGQLTSSDDEEVPKPRRPIIPETITDEAIETRDTQLEREKNERKKFEIGETKDSLEMALDVINSKEEEIGRLERTVDDLKHEISEKDGLLSAMAVDFAFVEDNITKVVAEKDALILALHKKTKRGLEIVTDTEALENLQLQFDEAKIKFEEELAKKDQQIRQLQALVKSLAPDASTATTTKSPDFARLQQKLDDALDSKASLEASWRDEREKLQNRVLQLEVLIRATDEQKRSGAALDAQLQIAKNQLTEKDGQLERLRSQATAVQGELKECRIKLEEAERKVRSVPEIEQKYRSLVEQLRTEHFSVVAELKQKNLAAKALGDKINEAQRTIRDLQVELHKSREESNAAREEAAFHRAKGEDVARKTNQESENVLREANAAVQHLHKQLKEKTKECDLYQRLLSDARRQLAPLTETTIPAYKAQVAKLSRERDELMKRVKHLNQLAEYVENTMTTERSADQTAFCAALHQLQEELKSFT
jgi:chromosome segregation ATPase